jgi:hypothetical protein
VYKLSVFCVLFLFYLPFRRGIQLTSNSAVVESQRMHLKYGFTPEWSTYFHSNRDPVQKPDVTESRGLVAVNHASNFDKKNQVSSLTFSWVFQSFIMSYVIVI